MHPSTIHPAAAPARADHSLETLPFEPAPAFRASSLQDDTPFASNLGKRIGILIVTYNAVTTLTKVLKRITPNVWENVEEIAVFDDASQDATYELAMGIKALRGITKLQVLSHPKNLGYGGNQKAGYRYFIEKGFDAVVLLHGDGQYAPEILSHLYHPIVTDEAEAVFGSRMMKDYGGPLKGGMPVYKYLGNRILTTFENRALGMHLTEFHSGYRAYSLAALRNIDFSHMTDDFHFDTEIIIKLNHQGYRIKEVPIPTYYGEELCYVDGMKYARDVARAVRRYKQTCRSVSCYREFQEYFVHYPIKHSRHSSHYYARLLTGSNHDVLDIGCGEGFFAAELAKSGNRITGVDDRTAPANDVFERYFSADLDGGIGSVIQKLQGQRFDRVLLLDVLEHLKSPGQILQQAHAALKREGSLIVSLPNVANIVVRLMLLFGQFNYQQRGLLDKTHLRFFTRKTARRLLEENGYSIEQERETVIPIELVLGWSEKNMVLRFLNRALAAATWLMPGLFGYQIMFVARSTRPGYNPA
ncbi:MAG TPA: bifunctional glycosyltransferase/class I SAM-dependent methyltransferase [Bryobacteraceae bacterium]|nr:bifunctional glycosyltransferase/class I SAM-dependent methyltransferase [Bryobacteraceae bacterium]